MVLTQSGKVYTWGLANDGRLGLGAKLYADETRDYCKFTAVPQQIPFAKSMHVDSVNAAGCIAYAQVTNLKMGDSLSLID